MCNRHQRTPTRASTTARLETSLKATSSCSLALLLMLSACTTPEHKHIQALYTEEEPYFKTCALRHGGTYRERELQQYPAVDIYQEPAPDAGPITEDCVVRE